MSLNIKKCTNYSGRALHQCKKAHCGKLALERSDLKSENSGLPVASAHACQKNVKRSKMASARETLKIEDAVNHGLNILGKGDLVLKDKQ